MKQEEREEAGGRAREGHTPHLCQSRRASCPPCCSRWSAPAAGEGRRGRGLGQGHGQGAGAGSGSGAGSKQPAGTPPPLRGAAVQACCAGNVPSPPPPPPPPPALPAPLPPPAPPPKGETAAAHRCLACPLTSPTSAFSRLLFPTLGRPMMATAAGRRGRG